MKKDMFDKLLESVHEAGQISRRETAPARHVAFDMPDIKALREKTGLSQTKFAVMIGVPVGTLRNWEQCRRKPDATAVALLKALQADTEAVVKALHT